mgnify:CR=1 FL=1
MFIPLGPIVIVTIPAFMLYTVYSVILCSPRTLSTETTRTGSAGRRLKELIEDVTTGTACRNRLPCGLQRLLVLEVDWFKITFEAGLGHHVTTCRCVL